MKSDKIIVLNPAGFRGQRTQKRRALFARLLKRLETNFRHHNGRGKYACGGGSSSRLYPACTANRCCCPQKSQQNGKKILRCSALETFPCAGKRNGDPVNLCQNPANTCIRSLFVRPCRRCVRGCLGKARTLPYFRRTWIASGSFWQAPGIHKNLGSDLPGA